ncbi:small ribosomal subunit biogenesis GTPase RsgA [Vibrio quintilis]|nr:small ribosomal subunit biogenesis GTPase RsgA [Vibrio quintilis]
MAKRKNLTKGQVRRVRHNQTKRLQKETSVEWDETMLGGPKPGLIISRFGQHADVEDAETQEVHRCNLRRGIETLVSGDHVMWRPGLESMAGIAGVIEAVEPRKSVLTRPDYYDGLKPVAANVDQMIIVSSVVPELSFNIIDRYLVAAETLGIHPVLVLNKIDLLSQQERTELTDMFNVYTDLGYTSLFVSKESGEGIEDLETLLKDNTNIFVGQSGVGKSSLVNAIIPMLEEAVEEGKISENSGLGQHTTTAARLYHIPTGGNLIDSPGVREFGLWHLSDEEVTQAFIEFRPYLGGCKFRDCKHKDDPGCLIIEALEQGKINPVRFENYHKILESLKENKANRQFSKNKRADL